jgi:hypothetical protein
MPARDKYHDTVKHALVKDGWTITHDPFMLRMGSKDLYVDLGAERLLAAEKAGQKIAVEVKSFLSDSEMEDLEQALGQFVLYHDVMEELYPDRILYLALPKDAYESIFEDPLGKVLLKNKRVRLIVFDPESEVLLQWIS